MSPGAGSEAADLRTRSRIAVTLSFFAFRPRFLSQIVQNCQARISRPFLAPRDHFQQSYEAKTLKTDSQMDLVVFIFLIGTKRLNGYLHVCIQLQYPFTIATPWGKDFIMDFIAFIFIYGLLPKLNIFSTRPAGARGGISTRVRPR